MSQQQNHNTNETSPFHWQLDPIHWQRSREAARSEAAQQPEGEYVYHDFPPSEGLPSPVETIYHPVDMTCGHYLVPEPHGITIDVPGSHHAGFAPRTHPEPIVCYGPPFGGPSEVMNGCPDLLPQLEEPGQEYFSPGGPPPPHPPQMPVFGLLLRGGLPQQPGREHVYPGGPPAPHHPPMSMPFWQPPPPPPPPLCPPWLPEDMIPGPPQPGWSFEGLTPCPNAGSAPRTLRSITCYGPCRDPAESPVTTGGVAAPDGPRSPGPGPAPDTSRVMACPPRRRRHSWS